MNLPLAFSTRKLYSGQDYCIRVRRASDNAEIDIGFSNNRIAFAAISAFCGSSIGYVTRFYNQGTLINNFVQTNTSLQPIIYDGSSFFTNAGEYYLSFATGRYMLLENTIPLADTITNKNSWISAVCRSQSGASTQGLIEERRISAQIERVSLYSGTASGGSRFRINYAPNGTNNFVVDSVDLSQNTFFVLGYSKNGNIPSAWKNNVKVGDALTSTASFGGDVTMTLGRQFQGSLNFSGLLSEVLVQNNFDATEFSGYANDQINYFGI